MTETEKERPAAEREQDGFTALVERRARFVFRVAYAVVRNAEDAEDVVQETFFKLYRTGAWQGMEDEAAFLARAAWRVAVSRKTKRRAEELGDPAWPGQGAEAELMANDRHRAVHRLIDALPEKLRRPLALSTVHELNSRQIAQVMGMSPGTVRTRLMEARRILREKLKLLENARR